MTDIEFKCIICFFFIILMIKGFILIFAGIFAKEAGAIIRWQSFWIGLHYSKWSNRYCLNLLPCVTIWWTGKNGVPADKSKM